MPLVDGVNHYGKGQSREIRMDIDFANHVAVERMIEARPILTGVATAHDVIPGMHDHLILHAGPPLSGSACLVHSEGRYWSNSLEGLASTDAEAVALVERGEAEFIPVIIMERQALWPELFLHP